MARSKRRDNIENNPEYNPHRTVDLFALTTDGYIVAQDILCQQEYIREQQCPNCGNALVVIANINRSFQGLNEVVVVCRGCSTKYSFIFDISNEVYQAWWAERMGDLYVRAYDGEPRIADPAQRYFSD
jgi:transcription elongation factor Elf1